MKTSSLLTVEPIEEEIDIRGLEKPEAGPVVVAHLDGPHALARFAPESGGAEAPVADPSVEAIALVVLRAAGVRDHLDPRVPDGDVSQMSMSFMSSRRTISMSSCTCSSLCVLGLVRRISVVKALLPWLIVPLAPSMSWVKKKSLSDVFWVVQVSASRTAALASTSPNP